MTVPGRRYDFSAPAGATPEDRVLLALLRRGAACVYGGAVARTWTFRTIAGTADWREAERRRRRGDRQPRRRPCPV